MTKVDIAADADVPLGKKVVAPEAGTDLKNISAAGIRMLICQDKVSVLEAQLKAAKEELRLLQEQELPGLMDAAGLKLFTLTSGAKFEVKDIVEGSIPKDNAEPAFDWLRKHGHAGLIKRTVSVPFSREEQERAQKLIALLVKSKIAFEDKQQVHHSTLAAWAREMLKQGKPFPNDLLGLFIGRRAVIVK